MQAARVAKHLQADLHGNLGGLAADRLELSLLVSPEQAPYLDAASLAPDGVALVVVPNQASFLALQQLDVPLMLVVPRGTPTLGKHPLMLVEDVRLSFALLSRMFNLRPTIAEGIHPSAVIHPSASLGNDVAIGMGAVIDKDVVIGRGSMIGPHACIGQGSKLGEYCRVHANATIYDGISIGKRVQIASGVVIGADSFGYALPRAGGKPERIAHSGTVILEDDVEIDANTTIDRGTLAATRIGAATKIGPLCSIAHNVQLGSQCLLVGNIGIAGSTVIGDRVHISGKVGINDHVTIGDDARIAAGSMVIRDVAAGEKVFGYPAQPIRQWAKAQHLQSRLAMIWRYVKQHGGA